MAREELAWFLRERRGGLRPHEIGLPAGPPRRTPGLRREEVAELARRRFLGQGRVYESSSAEEFGHIVVARLRRASDRYPQDAQLAALLADLRSGSEEFRRIWEARPVHAPGHRTKTLDHPVAGPLRLNCDVLLVPEDDQEVVLITADAGSPSARAVRGLAARAA